MLSRLLLLTILLALPCAAQTLYKLVKADGTVVFSDQPLPGAQPVNLPRVNTAVPLAKPTPPPPPQVQKPVQPDYRLSILSPAPEATLRNNAGNLQVSLSLQPQGAGQFRLWLDEEPTELQSTPVFNLEGVDRGEHHIRAEFLDQSGKVLAFTPSQVFYLHQASVLIQRN
ncbi:DUF4124 domain-containing protein [Aliiglaciecola sp. CAU 1673]|uniref:DUF4124 domain-containing protein n=1 Tax=Aliiglaciecola sp. CAU 1673 TaxID=3032595 RepID=UPI0023D97B3D|nr:DUF4124 domain-containing protein [Aliiglaciecola sp. CAU 1673]MDF2179189.1 DUF4124 domain-containing protein [Aliiglaciecola sp. CAU 1673]